MLLGQYNSAAGEVSSASFLANSARHFLAKLPSNKMSNPLVRSMYRFLLSIDVL